MAGQSSWTEPEIFDRKAQHSSTQLDGRIRREREWCEGGNEIWSIPSSDPVRRSWRQGWCHAGECSLYCRRPIRLANCRNRIDPAGFWPRLSPSRPSLIPRCKCTDWRCRHARFFSALSLRRCLNHWITSSVKRWGWISEKCIHHLTPYFYRWLYFVTGPSTIWASPWPVGWCCPGTRCRSGSNQNREFPGTGPMGSSLGRAGYKYPTSANPPIRLKMEI